jgi:hypothetical protein
VQKKKTEFETDPLWRKREMNKVSVIKYFNKGYPQYHTNPLNKYFQKQPWRSQAT